MDSGLGCCGGLGAVGHRCLYLAARVPAVWAGAPTPLSGLFGSWFGKSRRTYLMYVLTMNAWFDGVFLIATGMWLTIDPLWQIGTVLAVLGAPLIFLLWIVVAAFNRPRALVPPDQRSHRSD